MNRSGTDLSRARASTSLKGKEKCCIYHAFRNLFFDPVDGLQKSSLLGKVDLFKVISRLAMSNSTPRPKRFSLPIEVIINERNLLPPTVKQAQTHTLNFSNRGRWVGIFPGRPTTQHSASRFCPAAVESRTPKHVNRKKR